VVVIGAGNTAVDVATEAVRLGAERVTMVYRRTDAEMPAFAYEYDLAKSDGIQFVWEAQPIGFETDASGVLTGVRLQHVRSEGEGRAARLVPIEGSEHTLPCDMVVKALGQIPILDIVAHVEGARTDGGRLHIDPKTGATGVPGLFAGGDCTSKGAEIVNAVQEGKLAARGIDDFLTGR
jgi:glutamate synthase (NADPH/NADH) small chain